MARLGAISGRNPVLPVMHTLIAAIAVSLIGLITVAEVSAQESAGEISLAPGNGYLLIRLDFPSGDQIGNLDFTNVETGETINTRSEMYVAAGLNSWMGLISMPEGRYFCSRFDNLYRIGLEESRFGTSRRKRSPSTASDTFQIVPGAINYAGDWTMQFATDRLNPGVRLNNETLQRLIERFPDHTRRYEIYLSMMGKQAISLAAFLELVNENSEPEDR